MTFSAGGADDESSPIFGIKIPAGYRDWRLISVAHEEGSLNDMRAILGNDVAIGAAREGKLAVPGRHHHCPARLELRPFGGKRQSLWPAPIFVAGPPKNGVQFMVKDSENTPRRAAGASPNSTTANPPARRCKKPAFLATRPSKLATLSSTVTHLESRKRMSSMKTNKLLAAAVLAVAIGAPIAAYVQGLNTPESTASPGGALHSRIPHCQVDQSIRVGLSRARGRVAQFAAADGAGTARKSRPRRFLDLHLHQLAAHASLCPRLGREISKIKVWW